MEKSANDDRYDSVIAFADRYMLPLAIVSIVVTIVFIGVVVSY